MKAQNWVNEEGFIFKSRLDYNSSELSPNGIVGPVRFTKRSLAHSFDEHKFKERYDRDGIAITGFACACGTTVEVIF